MARRSGRQEQTTEPVSDYDYDDAPSGGIDLATSLTIFTFLFIVAGIIVTYMELKDKYDVGKEPRDHYVGYDERLGPESRGDAPMADEGDEGGSEEGGAEEGGAEEGGAEEGGSEEGGSEGGDDGFDDG